MKKKITALLLMMLAIFTASAKEYRYESVANDPMAARIYTLDNGLKVYISVNKETPRVTAHIAVNTGSRNDPAETTGLAHYLEHLMFKGSQSFGTTDYSLEAPILKKISDCYEVYRTLTDPQERKAKYREIDSLSQEAAKFNIPNEYDKMMSAIGSVGTNAYTSYDVTCYVEDIPSNEMERWCIVQSDRFQNFVMRGFHTELETVYEEKNISLTKDDRKSTTALLAKLFPNHPYGIQTTLGTQEHLKNPSQVNIRNYFNKYYVPNNIAICMAGDLDPDATIALIDKYFGAWKPGKDITAPQFPALPPLVAPQDTTVVGQETEHVIIGWRLNAASSVQNDTITMVDMLLSNGDVGLVDIDLNQKMRVLGAGTGVWALKDHGLFLMEAVPNEGQTLEEVRDILLAEVEKVKRGEWDERLLKSIVLNTRLSELNGLDNNRTRVSDMVDSYINGIPWQQMVTKTERIGRLTKEDITEWAKEHLADGYVCVYKRKGVDTTIVKIDKPEITPIPSNRDLRSQFIEDFERREVAPIQPQFLDFKKELSFGNTKKGLPIIYKQNTQDERFSLAYRFDFGSEADILYGIAADYYTLLGTDKESAEEIKRKFYDIACSYSVNVGDKSITVSLSGLQGNMPEAVRMLDNLLQNLKPDTAVYNRYVEQVQKSRMETRTNQGNCYNALVSYGIYGKKNPWTNTLSPAELRATHPKVLTDLMKTLCDVKHEVLYWGPATMTEVSRIVNKHHTLPRQLADSPVNKPYHPWETAETEIVIAPYDAKNIYMRMVHSEGRPMEVERKPVITLFNEYFGGSMNAVVFQELREARGLAYNATAAYVSPGRKGETEYYQQHIISQNDKLMDCVNVFKEITDTLPQSAAMFNIAKNSLMKTLAAQRATKAGVINRYISAREMGIDYDINKVMFEKIPPLTLQDLVTFEQQNIKGKPLRYLILGNAAELDMDALRRMGKVTQLTLDDIFPAY